MQAFTFTLGFLFIFLASPSILDFYCCISNYSRLSGFAWHTFFISQSAGQDPDKAYLSSLFRVSYMEIRLCSHSEACQGRVHFQNQSGHWQNVFPLGCMTEGLQGGLACCNPWGSKELDTTGSQQQSIHNVWRSAFWTSPHVSYMNVIIFCLLFRNLGHLDKSPCETKDHFHFGS